MEWLPIAISVFALIVSVGSAYFNIIRELEDFRVVIDGPFSIKSEGLRKVVVAQPHLTLTFANLGNRSIAVRAIRLRIARCTGRGCEDPIQWTTLGETRFDVKPFVTEPGKIIVKEIKLENETFTAEDPNDNLRENTGMFGALLHFDLITPKVQTVSEGQLVRQILFGRSTLTLGIPIISFPMSTRIIHRRWSTTFSKWK
jgi:hypothetical protein